jgi:hypothetical protein
MTVIINAGSRIGGEPQGWTNTIEQARKEARAWLDRMTAEGFTDVVLVDTGREEAGRWTFLFHHIVTGVEVPLRVHGIDDLDAYKRQHKFEPCVYWKDSSSAEPQLDDFAAHGFSKTMTFVAVSDE